MSVKISREILTAVPVAFHKDGRLDVEGSRQILKNVASSGVDAAFILGTTGEFPSLSFEERGAITRLAIEETADMRLVVHVGAASTYQVLQLLEQCKALGVTEVAVITPYYLPATDQALIDFYRDVSDASEGITVYLYLFRERTGNFVTESLLTELAKLPNIKGAKISGETLEQVARYRAAVPADFVLYTGEDRSYALAHDFGAQGVVSGVASVFPKPFVQMAAALESGSKEEITRLQASIDDAVGVLIGDMARMKVALGMQGIQGGYPRMSIEAPSKEIVAELQRAVGLYA